MNKKIVVVAGGLSIAALSLILFRSSEAPPPAGTAQVAAGPERDRPSPAPAAAQPAAAQAEVPVPARPPLTDEERKAEKERRRLAENAQPFHWERDAERNAELENDRRELGGRWAGEHADRSWSTNTAGRLSTILSRKGLDPAALKDVDCRETICRFALKAPSALHGDVWKTIRAARDIDEQTWTMPDQQEDGTYLVTVFIPRDGYRLSSGGGRISEPPRVLQ